jgi:hypothetical protein
MHALASLTGRAAMLMMLDMSLVLIPRETFIIHDTNLYDKCFPWN